MPLLYFAGRNRSVGNGVGMMQSTVEKGCAPISAYPIGASSERCEETLVPPQNGGGFVRTCACYSDYCNGSKIHQLRI
uniref:Uncharacterized protein n=1 Tax=Romanomermis culicivorax TaxID=13658 RepID=A0A915JH02_ROMCU